MQAPLRQILSASGSTEWFRVNSGLCQVRLDATAGNGFGCDLVGPDAVARTLSARYYKDGSEILIRQKGKNPRKLSIDECRKLMGYPVGFKPAGSKTQAYKQFGNSVVVPVVESIAHQVVKTLKTYEMVDGEVRKR